MFRPAERKKAKLRLALCGTSGGGKTYSSLLIAMGLGGKIAFVDSENGSGELYAHLCEYDVCPISPPFTPSKYIQAIKEAEKLGYDIIIVDSLTHAWAGSGGLLEEVDKRRASSNNPNGFSAWRDVTPLHNEFVDAMLQSSAHIIATMRSKTAYEMQRNEKGKMVPVKIGLQPVQRDGLDFEFTAVLDVDQEKHYATASKDRTGLFDGQSFIPSKETGKQLLDWLESGVDPDEAMVKEASELIESCTTADELRDLWARSGKRWQTRPKAFPQISALVAAKGKTFPAAKPSGPVEHEPQQYNQQPPRDEYAPGGGGMGDPVPSGENAQQQGTAQPQPMTDPQRKAIMAYFNDRAIPYNSHKDQCLGELTNFFQLAQPLTTTKDITKDMASRFIDAINQEAA